MSNKKSNDDTTLSKETSLSLMENMISTIGHEFKLRKLYQIGLMFQAGYDRQTIAGVLKTSPRYVSNCITKIRNDTKTGERLAGIIAQMPEWFRCSRQATLPVLAAAQNKAAQLYLEKPELLIDKPQLAKQMLMAAGVKTDQDRPAVMVQVNLGMLQQTQEAELKGLVEQPITVDYEEE